MKKKEKNMYGYLIAFETSEINFPSFPLPLQPCHHLLHVSLLFCACVYDPNCPICLRFEQVLYFNFIFIFFQFYFFLPPLI